MQQSSNVHRPLGLTIDRQAGVLEIRWADEHTSRYPLSWLRQVCPCATCREERRTANDDPLRLITGPPPSPVLQDIEVVGNYALRFTWVDGHGNGIYGFASLRSSCPCSECAGAELPELAESQ